MTFTPENPPKTDGDVRQLILETVMGIRDGSLDASQGAAMAANFKALNSTMTNSINAAKLSLLMEGSGRNLLKLCVWVSRILAEDQTKTKAEKNEGSQFIGIV